jgi:uncharacterized membrane protein
MSNRKDIFKEAESLGVTTETHSFTYISKTEDERIELRPLNKEAEQKLKQQNILFYVVLVTGVLLLAGSLVALFWPGVSPDNHSIASHTAVGIVGIIVGRFGKMNGVDVTDGDK